MILTMHLAIGTHGQIGTSNQVCEVHQDIQIYFLPEIHWIVKWTAFCTAEMWPKCSATEGMQMIYGMDSNRSDIRGVLKVMSEVM